MLKVGYGIVLVRKRLKIKQADLAKSVGLEPTYLARIENGRVRPSFELVARIRDALSTASGTAVSLDTICDAAELETPFAEYEEAEAALARELQGEGARASQVRMAGSEIPNLPLPAPALGADAPLTRADLAAAVAPLAPLAAQLQQLLDRADRAAPSDRADRLDSPSTPVAAGALTVDDITAAVTRAVEAAVAPLSERLTAALRALERPAATDAPDADAGTSASPAAPAASASAPAAAPAPAAPAASAITPLPPAPAAEGRPTPSKRPTRASHLVEETGGRTSPSTGQSAGPPHGKQALGP